MSTKRNLVRPTPEALKMLLEDAMAGGKWEDMSKELKIKVVERANTLAQDRFVPANAVTFFLVGQQLRTWIRV